MNLHFFDLFYQKNKNFDNKFDFLFGVLKFEESFDSCQIERKLTAVLIKKVFGNFCFSSIFNTKTILKNEFSIIIHFIFDKSIEKDDLDLIIKRFFNNEQNYNTNGLLLSNILYLSIDYYVKNLHQTHVLLQKKVFLIFSDGKTLKRKNLAFILSLINKKLQHKYYFIDKVLEIFLENEEEVNLSSFFSICFDFFELQKQKIEIYLKRFYRMFD